MQYYKFSQYLRDRFGCKVRKITVDAGFSCPNKDGLKSRNGCIYCGNEAFSPNYRAFPEPVEKQIREGINRSKKFGAKKFIIYFQANTNTYASIKDLKEKYDIIKNFENIAGISIGTRPDCVNDEILDLIDGYSGNYEVWIEYGLQSIHDKTLKAINRGHSYQDFLNAFQLTRKRKKIKICAHVILGLPDETKKDMLETASALAKLKIDGIKIHPLHVVKNTVLEKIFNEGRYKPLKKREYVNLVCGFLKLLGKEVIVQRVTADCPKKFLVAPEWILEKNALLKEIELDTI